ncbi:hypothetical protein CL633_01780 [bacterium]|nr:hypothetical protein [bacterium]|tara:strand:+ start:2893 stop:3594 length:702 start_codon:yes stop_codon:yes gene_type:complete
MKFSKILEKRKNELNKKLSLWGIPILQKLGNYKKKEFEATGEITSVYSVADPFFVVPSLEIRKPITGEKGLYSFISPRNFGVCAIVMINKKFIICEKQHRFPISKWVIEFPRGRVENLDNAGLELVKREAPQIFTVAKVDFAEKISRPIWEDTGIKNSAVVFYLIGFESEIDNAQELQNVLRENSSKSIKPCVFTFQQVNIMEDQEGLDDLHSLQAWSFAKKYLRKHFQIPII